MGDIVNLNKARKAKAKAASEKQAGDNRLKFGMTKAEKKKIADEKARLERHVAGHRLNDDDRQS
jgi:hypothetical protein